MSGRTGSAHCDRLLGIASGVRQGVREMTAVQRLGPRQFHWPQVDALEHPVQYPLRLTVF
jgi:hypothetical protein